MNRQDLVSAGGSVLAKFNISPQVLYYGFKFKLRSLLINICFEIARLQSTNVKTEKIKIIVL